MLFCDRVHAFRSHECAVVLHRCCCSRDRENVALICTIAGARRTSTPFSKLRQRRGCRMMRRTGIGTVVLGYTCNQVRTRILHRVPLEEEQPACQLTMFITSPSALRPLTRLSTVVCPFGTFLSSASDTGQTQRSRRWYSTNTVEPPPAGGHLTSVASSQLLQFTRETALRTPGLTWSDEDDSGPVRSIVGGRETSKMNMCQAVRDALRYDGWASLSVILTSWQYCTCKRRHRGSLRRGRRVWGCIPLHHGTIRTLSTCRSALMYPL